MRNHQKSPENRSSREYTIGQKLTAGAVGSLGFLGLAGCASGSQGSPNLPTSSISSTAANTAGPSPEATTGPTSTKSPEASTGSNPEYQAYIDTLTPDQIAFRDSLAPEKLISMSDAQITEAARIKLSAVEGADGKIDPEKYAIAVNSVEEALFNAGCTHEQYLQLGGSLDHIPVNAMGDLNTKYSNLITEGAFGQTLALNGSMASRCTVVYNAIDAGADVAPYKVLTRVNPGSVHTVSGDPTSINFLTTDIDNWDQATMVKYTYKEGVPPLNATGRASIEGLHVDSNGNVLPLTFTYTDS